MFDVREQIIRSQQLDQSVSYFIADADGTSLKPFLTVDELKTTSIVVKPKISHKIEVIFQSN